MPLFLRSWPCTSSQDVSEELDCGTRCGKFLVANLSGPIGVDHRPHALTIQITSLGKYGLEARIPSARILLLPAPNSEIYVDSAIALFEGEPIVMASYLKTVKLKSSMLLIDTLRTKWKMWDAESIYAKATLAP